MKNKKSKRVKNLAPLCPYCGSHTVLRSADGIYFDNKKHEMLYVCKNYPRCNSYIRVIPGTAIPLGTVANQELRALRNEAHKYLSLLYRDGFMTKQDAYQWLAGKMNIPASAAHIGKMGEYSCKQVIEICQNELSAMDSI